MNILYLGTMEFDISRSLRDYEYTKRSVADLNRVVKAEQFENMPAEMIFACLRDQMEVVSFGDYLRRYLYEGMGLTEPFPEVPEEYYISVISESFAINHAPHAFTPVRSKWRNIIRRWLRSGTARRSTVFLLGFGLKMDDHDVSDFLTKVLKEQDFRFCDPTEVVFWHCFHCGLPYSSALALLEEAGSLEAEVVSDSVSQGGTSMDEASQDGIAADTVSMNAGPIDNDTAPDYWDSIQDSLPIYLSDIDKLREYLRYLKHAGKDSSDIISHEFRILFGRAAAAARKITQNIPKNSFEEKDVREYKRSGAYDIESVLCGGIPRTVSGNLAPAAGSILSGQFLNKRMSRQRLSRLLTGQVPAERFDLITLLFLIYSIDRETELPEKRLMMFIDETNTILGRCAMAALYPVNPYESFVMMCLLTREPLIVYNDVWELSWTEEDGESE